MKTVEILHAAGYPENYFSGVKFPSRVNAKTYRFGDNAEHELPDLIQVPHEELVRIGYTGPRLECGTLSFGKFNHSWRDVEETPFDFWNSLKSSRDVGALPA